jgi:hypothetical protein
MTTTHNTISTDDRSIVIRAAGPCDAQAIRRLADLDAAAAPTGGVLLAEVGGEPRAALSLSDGRTIADPFTPTADLVALLALQARRLGATPRRRLGWRLGAIAGSRGSSQRRLSHAYAHRH